MRWQNIMKLNERCQVHIWGGTTLGTNAGFNLTWDETESWAGALALSAVRTESTPSSDFCLWSKKDLRGLRPSWKPSMFFLLSLWNYVGLQWTFSPAQKGKHPDTLRQNYHRSLISDKLLKRQALTRTAAHKLHLLLLSWIQSPKFKAKSTYCFLLLKWKAAPQGLWVLVA